MKVLITRTKEQALEFAERIVKLGYEPIFFPTIEITEPISWNEVDDVIARIETYTDIIFTSGNGVRYFFQRMQEISSLDKLNDKIFHTVGDKTKDAVASYGFHVSDSPKIFDSQSLAKEIVHRVILSEAKNLSKLNRKFLFPHGNLSDSSIEQTLKENKIEIDSIIVYQTIKQAIDEISKQNIWKQLSNNEINIVTFFSPSSVKHFKEIFPNFIEMKTIQIAVIGNTTKKACEEIGINSSSLFFIDELFNTNLKPQNSNHL
ncbi:MAG: uroporphyrinogen-III synthase [Ignavibacteriales bacterium]|nr:uroporphyrinogen-III synthase [Ignavibacteriales bacterium]